MQEARRDSVATRPLERNGRGAWKHKKGTIVIRWQEDAEHRNSQQAHGWTEASCRYLDFPTTSLTPHPGNQRHRYESTITLVCNDEDRQAGPMKARKDFKPTTKILARPNSFIPQNERMRQRPFDEALRAESEWMSQHWETYF